VSPILKFINFSGVPGLDLDSICFKFGSMLKMTPITFMKLLSFKDESWSSLVNSMKISEFEAADFTCSISFTLRIEYSSGF
jgi:hypothetical protein